MTDPKKKQAVVVIHGMGEQIPMETLRSVVKTVWETDSEVCSQGSDENQIWSKPDRRNRSFELRRITTQRSSEGKRTDFYEFYWAHLMHGTTWEHFKAWFFQLVLRWPSTVPKDVFLAWLVLLFLTLVVILFAAAAVLPAFEWIEALFGWSAPEWLQDGFFALLSIVGAWLINRVLLKYVGDVARYVKAMPPNVARRQEIREKGVELLETLMGINSSNFNEILRNWEKQEEGSQPLTWDTEYDRIIVISHSLGTIVAYDILKHCFARVNRFVEFDANSDQSELEALEEFLTNSVDEYYCDPKDKQEWQRKFRAHQDRCRRELNKLGNPWIVSDFITLGSPLTHAEFLLEKDKKNLVLQQQDRVLPTCPPTLEKFGNSSPWRVSYDRKLKNGEMVRIPHHAAHFAFTRWTNIYSRGIGVVFGDVISGPLADLFGLRLPDSDPARRCQLEGIRDVKVFPSDPDETEGRKLDHARWIAHTQYWKRKPDADPENEEYHILKLREAVNILDKPEELPTESSTAT